MLWKKENVAKVWESTTKVTNTARGTITAKAVRKEERKERNEKPAANSSFQGHCRTWKMGTQGE